MSPTIVLDARVLEENHGLGRALGQRPGVGPVLLPWTGVLHRASASFHRRVDEY